MQLWIMRHAAAMPYADSDSQRPLSEQGRQEALGMTAELQAARPTIFLCSPYLRTQQTAELLSSRLPHLPAPQLVDWLTPDTPASKVLERLQAFAGRDLLLVSHQPLVGELLGLLVDGSRSARLPMPTAALARLECDQPLAAAARLVSLQYP